MLNKLGPQFLTSSAYHRAVQVAIHEVMFQLGVTINSKPASYLIFDKV